ncbi:MAG: hypothetical protein H7222_08500 [Methylotenera sp.]|nr:hypothetical protein [Oligoflexia bacterium]
MKTAIRNFRPHASTVPLLMVLAVTSGCSVSKYAFVTAPKISLAMSAPIANTTTAPSDNTTKVFRTLQPALAVRGASCLSCHANVQSNMITDFGYGDSFFMEPGGGGNANGSMYFNHGLTSWQTAQITGSLIVPQVDLKLPELAKQARTVDPQGLSSSLSLAQFLQMPVIADLDGNRRNEPAMTVGVNPTGSALEVIEKKSIYIGAPADADILSLAPSLAASASGFVQVSNSLPGSPMVLKSAGTGSKLYLRNEAGPLNCYGDVVIKGTLFLNAPNIQTDAAGCRLYVAGSVFIQGKILLNGSSTSTHNLQITSSKAIMLGFDNTSVAERLNLGGDRTWLLPYAFTRGPGTNREKHQAVLDDAHLIADLVDGGNVTQDTNHLLLNAPLVHSRYAGNFTGAVIGEIVLFRLGQFSFRFDPVFEKVPVLPLLNVDILKIVD